MLFKNYKDTSLISMIRGTENDRNKALKFIYKKWRKASLIAIEKKGGTKEDAKDAIQEALILLDNNIRNFKYKGGNSLKSYFIGIAWRRWYSNTRSRNRTEYKAEELLIELKDLDTPEVLMFAKEHKILFSKILDRLGSKCKTLLSLYKQSYKMKEIATHLEIKSEGAAKKAVYQCRQKLKQLLLSNEAILKTLKDYF